MPVSVIVGGQFGSEGKGKVAHWLCKQENAAAAIRVGGTNSGHTVVTDSGDTVVLRQLPTAALLPNTICILPAGAYLDVEILMKEIELTNLSDERLIIDPNAMCIIAEDRERESNLNLARSIGSTNSGTGGAVIRRIERQDRIQLAQFDSRIEQYLNPVSHFTRSLLDRGERLVIEGTQGFGLSLLHGTDYPNITSRDTTAAAFVSEAGLSPLDVDDVVLVIRSFPIRVGGNSGPLPNEIDWSVVTQMSGYRHQLSERTSVTNSLRRVATFDPSVVREAISHNNPSRIVLNHLDYVDSSCSSNALTPRCFEFIAKCEEQLDATIGYFGNSPTRIASVRLESTKRSRRNGQLFLRNYG